MAYREATNAEHRIRLQISSGAHPMYSRNPSTGEPLATATAMRATDQEILHEAAHPSAVVLPAVTPARGREPTPPAS
jgi:uncharacterized protein